MRLSELRERCSFVTYGEVYEDMKTALKIAEWLNEKMYGEQPTSLGCHQWRSTYWRFNHLLKRFKQKLAKIPEPLEIHKHRPEKITDSAPWPEDNMIEIEEADDEKNNMLKAAAGAAWSRTVDEYMKQLPFQCELVASIKQQEEKRDVL